MTFIKYQHFNLRRSSYELIDRINMVIDDFQAEGYTATLRQIYYQLVQSNVIPNTVQSYDNLGVLIKKGRLMGLISWDAIETFIGDKELWERTLAEEAEKRKPLAQLHERWDDVKTFLARPILVPGVDYWEDAEL